MCIPKSQYVNITTRCLTLTRHGGILNFHLWISTSCNVWVRISRGTFEMPHKISCPYIERFFIFIQNCFDPPIPNCSKVFMRQTKQYVPMYDDLTYVAHNSIIMITYNNDTHLTKQFTFDIKFVTEILCCYHSITGLESSWKHRCKLWNDLLFVI